jgi:hypothetical protein
MINDVQYTPDQYYRFFLYDPEGDGITFYRTIADRDKAAKEAIDRCLDSGEWSEETDRILAGEVTHKATKIDIQYPVGKIDENNEDEEGTYWSNGIDYMCDYEMKPLRNKVKLTENLK